VRVSHLQSAFLLQFISNFHTVPFRIYYDYQLSKARRKFSDELLALKLGCCHGQLTSFPLVTISTDVNCLQIRALCCQWRQRPASCRWKQSQLPVTTRFSRWNLVIKLLSCLTQLIIVVINHILCSTFILQVLIFVHFANGTGTWSAKSEFQQEKHQQN